jgi:hypothetical protein
MQWMSMLLNVPQTHCGTPLAFNLHCRWRIHTATETSGGLSEVDEKVARASAPRVTIER